jgi:membrane protease YdiL (CAAX protease family)
MREHAPGPEGFRASASRRVFAPFLALFFLAWALRGTVLFGLDGAIEPELLRRVYSNGVKFLLWVVPVFAYLKYVDRTSPLAYLRLTTRPHRFGVLRAAAATLLFFSAVMAFEGVVSGRDVAAALTRAQAPGALAVLLSIAVSPLFEEIFFRGFVLRKLLEAWAFWPANLLTSLLFVAIHWPNWLWVNGPAPWIAPVSATVFVLGCFLGYLVRETNSLWPSVVAHIANNFLAAMFAG